MTYGQLHLHTAASDGTIVPEMLQPLSFAAITDHDTFSGLSQFKNHPTAEIIPGIELSVVFQEKKLHVIILQPRPDAGFFDGLRRLKQQREMKVQKLLDRLAPFGLRLTRFPDAWPGITKRKVLELIAEDPANAEAFALHRLTGPKSIKRLCVPEDVNLTPDGIPIEDAVASCEGIYILAHPGASLNLEDPADQNLLSELFKRFPFSGVEVITRRHPERDRALAAALAERQQLVAVTANDVHASQDINENRTPWSQVELLYERNDFIRADWSLLLNEN